MTNEELDLIEARIEMAVAQKYVRVTSMLAEASELIYDMSNIIYGLAERVDALENARLLQGIEKAKVMENG